MKTSYLIIFVIIPHLLLSRNYINNINFDYINTNTNSFVINSSSVDEANDFLSTMLLSKYIAQVATDGKTLNIPSANGLVVFKISREKFIKPNLASIFDNFMDEMKLVVIEPLNGQINKNCVLITCGGGNMNDSYRAFYLGIAQYAMKGYVVAYYENPNSARNVDNQGSFLISELPQSEKTCFVQKNCPPSVFRSFYSMSLYLGVQTANAAVNYMAANSNLYNLDVNNFFASGQSYGGFCTISLGLGSKNNYYDQSGTLKKPFNYIGNPNFYSVSRNNYTIKAITPWAGNYPTVDNMPTHDNPFGEFIDNIQNHIEKNGSYIDKPDARVLHFHGQLDSEINVNEGWLNGSTDSSIFSHGPYQVVNRYQKANVPFYSFINCIGGHGVINFHNESTIPNDFESRYSNYIDTLNYSKIEFYKFNSILYELSFNQGQLMEIIDRSTFFYQNNTSQYKIMTFNQSSYKAKSIIKGKYFEMDNCFIPVFVPSEIDKQTNITIFPNPSNDYLNILANNKDEINIESISIYNLLGKCIDKVDIVQYENGFRINLMNLSNGVYVLKISNPIKNDITDLKMFIKM